MLATRDFSLTDDAFLLDVDGTIVDIAAEPDKTCVPASLKRSLGRLHQKSGGAVALVSGRTLANLDALFAPLVLPAIGCHGAEWRIAAGAESRSRVQPLPEPLRHALHDIAEREPRIRIEDKYYAMAFHYRLAPDRAQPLLALLDECLAPFRAHYMLLRGKAVFEVKLRAFNKGEAVRALLQHPPFARRRPIQFGDDTTDEDAFAAVQALGGIGISVGGPLHHAELVAPSPQAVRLWLAEMAGDEGQTIE